MWSICKKEVNQFFSSLTGIIAIILFLLINGIFLFLLKDSSIFEYGYATPEKFFDLAPWVLMFLVPSIAMRSFSDEYRSGTFEILRTRPLKASDIVNGKYLAILLVVVLSVIPTFMYIYTIGSLSGDGGIDAGGITGSYIGLFLLAATFASISTYCSSLTVNAVAAFLISAFTCLILYYGFHQLSAIESLQGNADYYIEMLGIDFHYRSISRGVMDSRDIIYFLSIIILALFGTVKNIRNR